jgi:hypothetical protein
LGPHRRLPIDERTKWRINVEMPRDLYETLAADAERKHGPVSVLVRQIIDAHYNGSVDDHPQAKAS